MPVELATRKTAFDVYHAYVGDSDDDSADGACSPSQAKQTALDMTAKEFDPVTFDVLRVPPEDFASQITILDLPVFQSIQPEELVTCGWTTKNKQAISPNVVAFTRRFNHVCLWCQREILSRVRPKQRAEVITHFIRIAKRLLDLNNMHSAFAIVSGLQSSPIHRLRLSWASVSAKDRASLEKLSRLFADDSNFDRLRKYMESAKLPCIPYLGLYLTDLVYIDVAHPRSGTLDRDQRSLQMNNIIRVLAEFQRSEYSDCAPIDCVQSFLQSIRYIDELQKFVEDDLYRQSLELEPNENSAHELTSSASGAALHEKLLRSESLAMARRESFPVVDRVLHGGRTSTMIHHKLSIVEADVGHLKLKDSSVVHQQQHKSGKRTAYVRQHRKAQSLGNPSQFKFMNEPGNETIDGWSGYQQHQVRHHLLDDSLLDSFECNKTSPAVVDGNRHDTNDTRDSGLDTCNEGASNSSPSTTKTNSMTSHRSVTIGGVTDITSLVSPGCSSSVSQHPAPRASSASACQPDASDAPADRLTNMTFSFQGPVRRKTLLKDGRRPTMQSWTRYWCALSDTNLCYFAARPLPVRNMDARTAYKQKPYKIQSISGWMVVLSNDPVCPDAINLQEPSKGHVYRFRCGSQSMAIRWAAELKRAAKKHQKALPENLIAFD